MPTIAEIEDLALQLPELNRAELANKLIHSLPYEYDDDAEGLAEAARRGDELEENPSLGITEAELLDIVRANWPKP